MDDLSSGRERVLNHLLLSEFGERAKDRIGTRSPFLLSEEELGRITRCEAVQVVSAIRALLDHIAALSAPTPGEDDG